jgi:hypothetical protein
MRQVRWFVFVVCTLCVLQGAGRAQPVTPSPQSPAATQASGDQLTPYQGQTLEIERAKINLQREQLELEKKKAWWTDLGVIVPIIAGFVAVAAAFTTLWVQVRSQFQLKAAELVLSSYSPGAASNRAQLLRDMFPILLSGRFAHDFKPEIFPGVRLHEMKTDLFRALTAKDANRQKVWEAWLEVFPEERARFAQMFPSAMDAIPAGNEDDKIKDKDEGKAANCGGGG